VKEVKIIYIECVKMLMQLVGVVGNVILPEVVAFS
jgi:hypothetical protein